MCLVPGMCKTGAASTSSVWNSSRGDEHVKDASISSSTASDGAFASKQTTIKHEINEMLMKISLSSIINQNIL